MKQIIQDLKSGETILESVPAPTIRRGCVLIRTHRSLVSLGTERMLVEFGKANFLDKARQQPEKVKQVFDKDFDRIRLAQRFLDIMKNIVAR
jgi:hypothetical protein